MRQPVSDKRQQFFFIQPFQDRSAENQVRLLVEINDAGIQLISGMGVLRLVSHYRHRTEPELFPDPIDLPEQGRFAVPAEPVCILQ